MSRKGISIGLIALLLIVIVLAAFLPLPGIAVPDQNRQLTILFTHDLHSHFDPNKVVNEQDEVVLLGGLARLAAIIEREKAANPGRVLVVDAGDFSMGTLIHTLFRTEAAEIRLMGKIGYDATTIGNHELDFDSSGLASMLTAAKASGDPLPCLLAANIKVKPDKASQSRLKQALDSFRLNLIRDREGRNPYQGLRLLGRSATRDLVWDEDIEVEDQIATARKIVKQLRRKKSRPYRLPVPQRHPDRG